MSGTDIRAEEQAAADAICAVEDVVRCERLVPSGSAKTPDWRVTMTDGRVADVEVTTVPNGDVRSFSAELHDKDGSFKTWSDERLSCRWTVFVFDRDPGTNKKRRPLETLVECLASTLAAVEAEGGTPKQMESRARAALDGSLMVSRATDVTVTVTDFPGLQLDDGEHSQNLYLPGAPQLVGHGKGSVVLVPCVGPRGFAGHGLLVSAVQDCIRHKTNKRQLDNAPGLRWLGVALDGIYAFQLKNVYNGPYSQPPHPIFDITFDYFDDVWAIARTRIGEDHQGGFVVLRMSEGGDRQQPYVVPRP